MRLNLAGLLATVLLVACGGTSAPDARARKAAAGGDDDADSTGGATTSGGSRGAPPSSSARPPGASAAPSPGMPFGSGAGFSAMSPVRLVDSRDGTGLAPATFVGPLTPNVERSIDLRGLDAELGPIGSRVGLALNVAVTDTTAHGFLRVYPCGTSSDAATVNFNPGENVAAMALVEAGESVCVLSSATTNLVIDALGAFEKDRGARFTPLAPRRIFDSRGAARSTTFRLPVPELGAAATGVAAHLTITDPAGPGFARAHRCGAEPPTSSINFAAGETIGTTVLTSLDDAKNLCVTATVDVHLIIDIEASFGGGTDGFVPTTPRRVFDSRETVGAGATTFELTIPNLPKNATTAVLNLSAVGAPVDAFVTAHACGSATSTANLNVAPGQVRTTAAFVPVTPDGRVCVDANHPLHVIADVVGFLAP